MGTMVEELGATLVKASIGVAAAWAERWGVGVCDVRAVWARPGDGRSSHAWAAEVWGPRGARELVAPMRGPVAALGALLDKADNDVTKEGA